MKNPNVKPNVLDEQVQKLVNLCDQGEFELVLSKVELLIDMYPDAPALLNIRGIALINRGDRGAALKSYDQALKLDPNYTEAHFNMGTILRETGFLTEAINSYQKVIDLEPNSFESYFLMGEIHLKMLKLEAAIGNFKRALTIKPDYVLAHQEMSHCLRDYIWSLNIKLVDNLETIDDLIKSEQKKLRTKIRKTPIWFVDIPATSSTAIKVGLGAKLGWPFGQSSYRDITGRVITSMLKSLLVPDHTPAFIVKHILGDGLWAEIDTFTVVRNPYSWCASLWHYAMKYNNLGFKTNSFDQFLSSFEEKLEDNYTKRKIFPSNYRQTDYILDENKKVLLKNIFRLEDKETIKNFLKAMGVTDYDEGNRIIETQ